MSNYFKAKKHNKVYYSIDGVIVYYTLTTEFLEYIRSVEGCFSLDSGLKLKRFRDKGTHYGYVIATDRSEKLILCINKSNGDCNIKCNPNKTFGDINCMQFIHFMLQNSLCYRIHKHDIAIDYPIKRNFVIASKDKRNKTTYQTSKNDVGTVYLGRRGNPGNVKVYDKQKESKLPNPLTRVELTLGNPMHQNWEKKLNDYFPSLSTRVSDPKNIADKTLSSTDQALIVALSTSTEWECAFNMLDIKKRRKLEPFLLKKSKLFTLEIEPIKAVIANIFDAINIETSYRDGDKMIVPHTIEDDDTPEYNYADGAVLDDSVPLGEEPPEDFNSNDDEYQKYPRIDDEDIWECIAPTDDDYHIDVEDILDGSVPVGDEPPEDEHQKHPHIDDEDIWGCIAPDDYDPPENS